MTTTTFAPGNPYHPPADAVGLGAIRILKNGTMRQYSAVEFNRGWNGVEHFVRTLRVLGYVKPSSSERSAGVLDVINADGDIIGDYDIPTAAALRYIKRKLKLTVVHSPEEATRSRD